MTEREISFLLTLGEGAEPPTEFEIFHAGVNKTLKGDVVINERAIASIFAAEKARGRKEIPFDYGHAAVQGQQTSESIKASAWGTLAERNGGISVTKIQWTPVAAAMIKDREARFTSPAIMIDTRTNEMRSLTNIALTNLPATVGQTPLVASSVDPAAPAVNLKESSMDEKELMRLMMAVGATDAEGIGPALAALKKERDTLLTATTESQKELATAQATLKSLGEDSEKAAHASILTELNDAKKLSPALQEWALTQTAASLRTFGEKATPLVPTQDNKPVTPPTKTQKAGEHSVDTRKVFTAMNLSAAEFEAERKHLDSQDNFWECNPEEGPEGEGDVK